MVNWEDRPRPKANQNTDDVDAERLAFMRKFTEGWEMDHILMALFNALDTADMARKNASYAYSNLEQLRKLMERF
jgi:hypothetical protein